MKITKELMSRSLVIGISSLGLWQAAAQQAIMDNSNWPERRGATFLVNNNPYPALQNITRITGAMVKDLQGQTVGRIQDVLATPAGSIDFAVVSLDNKPGQYTAVPWGLLRQTTPHTYVFNAEPNKIYSARTFTANNWPNFANSDYLPRIYTHYGITYPPAMGGNVVLPSGVATGTEYSTREGYEAGKAWIRPQPDGRDVFPWLNHPEAPWK